MSGVIIDLQTWLDSPAGRYQQTWEQKQLGSVVPDIFGYHALQLGLPQLDALEGSRMPHQWYCDESIMSHEPDAKNLPIDFVADFAALPFSANSLDLLVLAHTLELHPDPHAVLREVERVLMPEGRVIITGFNPFSWWGLRQWRGKILRRLGLHLLGTGHLYLPQEVEFIASRRMRDWLRLLNFEVESARFGCYKPAVRSDKWLARYDWLDRLGNRWWPVLGANYMLVAVKRVRGLRLISPVWKSSRTRVPSAVPAASSIHQVHSSVNMFPTPHSPSVATPSTE